MTIEAPSSLHGIAERVEQRLAEVLEPEVERWTALDPALAEPLHELRRLVLGGGKRLRAAFCHWGYVAAGGDPDDQIVVDAGAAFELMHACALFHDDVIDDAPTRRGQPTTHVVFADRHRAGEWSGEARRFGEGMAVLVGDLAFVYADRMLAGANATAWDVWNELRVEVNVGQMLDVIGTVHGVPDVRRAELICRYKSGKYTIERPLHLGAALASPARFATIAEVLSGYGLPLGDAFQMRDDVMGAFGDSAVTGKPVGADLREGKPTPLLARAYAAADGGQRGVLEAVGRPGLDDADVERIQQVIVDTGALTDLEATIESRIGSAIAALDGAAIAPSARHELSAIAAYVGGRSA